jgi:hypothetical protein
VTTWAAVHAGDIVLGHDGQEWGVLAVSSPAVTLTRYGRTVAGRPDPADPVVITRPADHAATATAVDVLIAAGFVPEIISESIGESA